MSTFQNLSPRPGLSHVVFDFDGTLSWLRHGWPGIMCEVFEEHLLPDRDFWPGVTRDLLLGEIIALNGKPSIYQCQRFVDLLAEHGGPSLHAEPLRIEFQRRLDHAIERRVAALRSGEKPAEAYLIPGAKAFLEEVITAGLVAVILSSTVQERVVEEAGLLGIASFFGQHIYGGTGDPLRFTKRAIFERLLHEEGVTGAQLLSFGDGPVELRDTKELGGVAIALCSDEESNGSGLIDPHKQFHLLAVGADAVLPDYREAPALLRHLLQRA